MSIEIFDDPVERRSVKDVKRHQEKVMDAIKKQVRDIIANEDIITGRPGKKVRIRVKALKSFRFIFGRDQGIGSGPGDGPGGDAGDEEGDEIFDTEMELEELIEIALKECGLPNLQKKEETTSEVLEGFEVKKIRKSGIWSLLHRRKTVIEARLRKIAYVKTLMRLTGLSEEDCEKAYNEAHGDFRKAYLALLAKINLTKTPDEIEGEVLSAAEEAKKSTKLFFREEDLRFREIVEKFEEQSNAIVYAIRDASGSMTDDKKFLSRMMLFWLVSALRLLYQNVEIKFILHTTSAEFVSEKDFFMRSESGGTVAASGYELARKDIDLAYSPDRWNVYVFHFSDGDDFEPDRAVTEALKIMDMGINMFGYGEISTHYPTSLMRSFTSKIVKHKVETHDNGLRIITALDPTKPFLAACFSDTKHLLPILKEFLKRERKEWTQ